MESFAIVTINFWCFQWSLSYLAKFFWLNLNSPNLISQIFRVSNLCKKLISSITTQKLKNSKIILMKLNFTKWFLKFYTITHLYKMIECLLSLIIINNETTFSKLLFSLHSINFKQIVLFFHQNSKKGPSTSLALMSWCHRKYSSVIIS